MTVHPLTHDDVPAAAALLAARQRRLRRVRAELPEAYSEPAACEPIIHAQLEQADAHGVLLEGDDGPVGYLLGGPKSEPIWGRACWSAIDGSALADGIDGESIRDLYAPWSEHFVRRGFFLHYVHASPDEADLMAAWVRTGFGQMQAHAVRSLDLEAPQLTGVTVRRAVPEDIDALEPLLPLIALALVRPPAYAARFPEELPTYRDSWLEELSGSAGRHWLADEAGRPLAMASFYPAEPGPMVPDGAWELAVAMTLPEARGRGLMRGLLAAGFAEMRQAGARHCITDWRTASLSTHRSWTALGFVPTHYRLHRHIDERITWSAVAEPGD